MGCGGSKPIVASSYRETKPQEQEVPQGNGHTKAADPIAAKPADAAPPPPAPAQYPEAPPTPPQVEPATNGVATAGEPKLRSDILEMTEKKASPSEDQEQEDSVAFGDLPVLPKKQRSSIRRATPQVQSMSASMKRASREKVVPSSRSSSFASEAISE